MPNTRYSTWIIHHQSIFHAAHRLSHVRDEGFSRRFWRYPKLATVRYSLICPHNIQLACVPVQNTENRSWVRIVGLRYDLQLWTPYFRELTLPDYTNLYLCSM